MPGLNNKIIKFYHSYMNMFNHRVGVPRDIELGLQDLAAATE